MRMISRAASIFAAPVVVLVVVFSAFSARSALAQTGAGGAAAAPPPAAAPAAAPAAPAAPAPLESTQLAPAEPAKDAAKAGGPGAGLGLSPATPQIGAGAMISAKEGEALSSTVTTGGSDDWKFDFHGYMRGTMRVSMGPPTPASNPHPDSTLQRPYMFPPNSNDWPPGLELHGWPRVPGMNYINWEYTNTIPGPWAQLNFSYGNSRAMMTVAIDSYNQTSGGYRNLQAQQGIDQAFVTLNFPDVFGDRGGLVWNIGTFQNRYGTAGKYDAGMYETYLFGRTHVAGETLTANIDVAPEWGLSVEKGIGAKTEIIPFTNNQLYQIFKSRLADGGPGGDQAPVANGYGLADRDNEYLPYAGPVPQGSTFLAHGHLGLAYRKMVTFGGHFLYSWTPDDNWHRVNSVLGDNINANPRASGKTKGSMTVFGGDVRLNGGVLGDGYIGYSRIDAKDINALADGIEVLHSFGGWQFKQNFFGRSFHPHTGIYQGPQNESGTVDTVLFQYTFSFGALARYPENFWGQGPDIAVTAFGMFNRIQSQHPSGNPAWNLNTKKLKLGGDIIYTPISWFGVGGRFDWVQPDLDAALARQVGNPGGSQLSFMVFSPRVVFRTQFVTHEAVTLQFQRYVLGDAAYPVYPYEWVPKADTYVFSIAGTMWW